jgi:aldose 1-epimerase
VTVPLTGQQYQISAGPYRATVTELGAGLRELLWRDQPVIVGYEADELPPSGAGQLLAPWPNRIDGGQYAFGGTQFHLALTEPARGNAIHGLTRWTAWTPVSHDLSSVVLRCAPHGWQGYPFCVEIEAGYRLGADSGLHVAITARNLGSQAAPYGTGSHPYLTLGTSSVDGCELALPAASRLPVDDRGIPAGPAAAVEGTQYDFRRARPIGTTQLDDALTGLERDRDGRAWAHLSAGGSGAAPGSGSASSSGSAARVSLWAGDGYRWLQVFTGDPLGPERRRKALAVEPMTCPPNAFVTGEDLLVLRPGEAVTHTWGIQAS